MAAATTTRPITLEDREFLFRLYASTRADEMALVDWSEEQKESFLRFQFDAQHKYYQEQFPRAAFDLILLDGEPIGAVNRVPPQGDVRANLHVGGRAEAAELSARDREICEAIGPALRGAASVARPPSGSRSCSITPSAPAIRPLRGSSPDRPPAMTMPTRRRRPNGTSTR